MYIFSFFKRPAAPGIVLISSAVFSLIGANLFFGDSYVRFWNTTMIGRPLEFWINDGLMTVFFFQIGLELRWEMADGELAHLKRALLPAFAAVGGMAVPVLLYVFFNAGTPIIRGLGVPMATDIAFALSIISLLKSRVPAYLPVFLKTLAIFDDLGAILVIAFFYTVQISIPFLFASLLIYLILKVFNYLNINSLALYFAGGAALWFCFEKSGIHVAISGVALAFVIPPSKSERVEKTIDPWVNFAILPLFALANTAIVFSPGWTSTLFAPLSIGVFSGLVLGKPAGILLFSWIGVRLGWASLPSPVALKDVLGAGILGGIGFTMSIFITLLAFSDPLLIAQSKSAILLASTASGIIGYAFLRLFSNKTAGAYTSAA